MLRRLTSHKSFTVSVTWEKHEFYLGTVVSLTVSFFAGCDCNLEGVLPEICDDRGRCLCRPGVEGPQCDSCRSGSYSFPICQGKKINCRNADHCFPGWTPKGAQIGLCQSLIACGLTSFICGCNIYCPLRPSLFPLCPPSSMVVKYLDCALSPWVQVLALKSQWCHSLGPCQDRRRGGAGRVPPAWMSQAVPIFAEILKRLWPFVRTGA